MATFVTAMLDGREPYDIYRWAEQLFADRDHLAAIEALEYLMDRAPDSELGSARELLARSYYHSAQLDRAADAARDILAKDPFEIAGLSGTIEIAPFRWQTNRPAHLPPL